jgi:heptosyltransferase-2
MIARLVERAARRAVHRARLVSRGAALRLAHWPPFEQRRVDPANVHRILAVRLDRLGDLVLTLPALDALAESYPNAHRMVMVRPALAPLIHGRPSVHRVVVAEHDSDVEALARRMASCEADLAVDFSAVDDLRAARALVLAGVRDRVGLAGGGREVYFTNTASPDRPCSLSELNGRVVEAAGGVPSAVAPSVTVSPRARSDAEALLRGLGAPSGWPRIAVHPGGHHATQRWPVERFADVAVALAVRRGGRVVILSGPGEEELVRALYRCGSEHSVIVPAVDVLSLAAVLGCCDVLLANNSGPLHLAAAVGLRTVSVMGPTDPVRFWPMGREQSVFRLPDLACSPCSRGRCGPHDCLRGIGVSEVLDAAQRLLDAALSDARPPDGTARQLPAVGAGAVMA